MEDAPKNVWRIVDANLNRIGEGLRVLEELARLALNDVEITQRLKNMRHELVRVDSRLQPLLLSARDSEGDVGVAMEVAGEEKQRDMPETILANSRRVQESLRVMEEIARTRGPGLDTEKYKKARFSLYTLEKELYSRMQRRDKIQRLRGLYVIIDTAVLKGRDHLEVATQAIRGGTKVIQLRDKTNNKKRLLLIARRLRDLCLEQKVLFIVNDYLDIALAVDADGLHVGQDDLPVKEARRLLPIDKILGCSADTVKEATAAQAEGADYIAVGAMFHTPSKELIEVVGPERLKEIRQAVSLPLVAIGGINKDNVREVIEAGASAAAVISAVLGADDVEEAARTMTEKIENERLKESGTDCRANSGSPYSQ